uniref:Uncharacterized protein n=1 Tax=viral metagenome TaxID=1070528 RepID=A0A6M3JUJ0_9ZZZZ
MVEPIVTFKKVTKVVIAPKQPPPKIVREVVDGKEKVEGRTQYATSLIPDGQVVTVEKKANGVVVETLGPWTAESLPNRNASVQVRMKVSNNCKVSEFPAVELLEPLGGL